MDVLREIGMEGNLRKLIWQCLSSVSCKIIVNGEMTEFQV